MKKQKEFDIHTSKGIIHIVIGDTYKGMGYSGMSDGVEITGTLDEYDQQLDSAILKDNKGMIHAVIPATLEKIE